MKKRIRADEAFEQRLAGQLPEASAQVDRLAKLAEALQPAAPGPAPSSQFRARLRNELLAAASQNAQEEEDLFAMLLEGAPDEAPAELRPLVAVASALRTERLPTPDPAFRYQLRNRLVAAATPQPFVLARIAGKVSGWNTRMRRNLKVITATGLATLMMLGAGASLAASRQALPGSLLYPLKIFQESAQLVGSSGAPRAQKLLGFARVRLSEVDALVAKGERDSRLYVDTLNAMDELTIKGRDLLLDTYRTTREVKLLRDLEAFAREQAADLATLVPRLPPAARPVAQDSLTLVDSIARQTLEALTFVCTVCPDGFSNPVQATGGAPTVEDEVACACETAPEDPNGGPSGAGPDGDPGDPDDPGTDPGEPTPSPSPSPKRVDIDDPTGNGIDEPVETIINDLLDRIEEISPAPIPTVPALSSTAPVPSL